MSFRSAIEISWVVGNTLLVLSLLSSSYRSRSMHVDRIEINTCHCYSAPFDQVIFWEWNETYCRYDVLGWCGIEQVGFIPNGVMHDSGWAVRSRIVCRTETLEDPEKVNRELTPDHFRKRLPWERFSK